MHCCSNVLVLSFYFTFIFAISELDLSNLKGGKLHSQAATFCDIKANGNQTFTKRGGLTLKRKGVSRFFVVVRDTLTWSMGLVRDNGKKIPVSSSDGFARDLGNDWRRRRRR